MIAQQAGSDILWFLYDSDGNRVGFTYNGTAYYYTKNAQGDVTGIVDGNCNTVVEYSYDAWGKLLSTTGSLAGTIGKVNPFLYRGYCYDSETGLYYLNSGIMTRRPADSSARTDNSIHRRVSLVTTCLLIATTIPSL